MFYHASGQLLIFSEGFQEAWKRISEVLGDDNFLRQRLPWLTSGVPWAPLGSARTTGEGQGRSCNPEKKVVLNGLAP